MRIFLFVLSFIGLMGFQATAQDEITDENNTIPLDIGLEYQMYPAGMMPGLRAEIGLGTYKNHGLNLRVGYNRARRNDWGEHADERGGGWGASLGYRYYLKGRLNGFFLGARTDYWKLDIDWTNTGADGDLWTSDDDTGTTEIHILQPTAELGYIFFLGQKKRIFLTPKINWGWEKNIVTNGEPVGQGAIFLWGIDFGYRF